MTWNCFGDPPDVAPGWRIEIASVSSAPGALEKATQSAQEKLRAKLCVNADKDRTVADSCSYLVSKLEPWKTGANDRDVCASAVVRRQYVEEWEHLAGDLAGFDTSLAAAVNKLLAGAESKSPRIALAAVYDDNGPDAKQNQLPGGRRADWLAARFRSNVRGGILPTPKAWGEGLPVPDGVDLVVVGHMWKRVGVRVPSVEVSWTGYTAQGRQIEVSSGAFPEAAAPAPPSSTPPALPTSQGLHLTMDSDHAGSICAGETTQLWLKSSEQLHVRVFDLWGTDGAMLIYPSATAKSDIVPANRAIPLGDEKGFEAVPAPNSTDERYLVIAADTPAGLGRFANTKSDCRLDASEGRALHRGESIPPGARTAVTGYRLLTGSTCPPPPSAEHLKAAERAIERLPVCPH